MCKLNYVKALQEKKLDYGEWLKEESSGIQGLEYKLCSWTNLYLIPSLTLTDGATLAKSQWPHL